MSRKARAVAIALVESVVVLIAFTVIRDDARELGLLAIANVAAVYALLVRQRRKEHEPDEMPSHRQLLSEVLEDQGVFALVPVAYLLLFLVLDDRGVLVALLTSFMIVVGALTGAVTNLRRQGLERDQFLLSTSIAFVITTSACGVWSMFQQFAEAPRPTALTIWAIGLASWMGATFVVRRRSA